MSSVVSNVGVGVSGYGGITDSGMLPLVVMTLGCTDWKLGLFMGYNGV